MRQTQKGFAFDKLAANFRARLPGFGTLRAPRFAQAVSSVRIDSGLPDSPTSSRKIAARICFPPFDLIFPILSVRSFTPCFQPNFSYVYYFQFTIPW